MLNHTAATPAAQPRGAEAGAQAEHDGAHDVETERFSPPSRSIAGDSRIGFRLDLLQGIRSGALPQLLENKYYVDEIYDAAVVEPLEHLSRDGFWKIFDVKSSTAL